MPRKKTTELQTFSQLMQLFKATEYYAVLYDKLNSDWQKHSNSLRKKDNEQVRGRIQYIEELFGWIDEVAKEDLKIEELKEFIKQENDY